MITAIPPYVLLLAVIVLIYLIDCVMLLFANEAIVKSHEDRWQVDFGSRQNWFAGKRFYLLNPFTPLTAIYRMHWTIVDVLPFAGESARAQWAEHMCLIGRLGTRVAATGWVVLVILPGAMLLWGARGFLVGAALSWLTVIVLLARFLACRRALDLSLGDGLLIAFECLACPPCAVNLLRKLSLRYRTKLDLAAVAASLETEHAEIVLDHIGQQTDAHLLMLEVESSEYKKISAYRELIRAEHSRLIAARLNPHEL